MRHWKPALLVILGLTLTILLQLLQRYLSTAFPDGLFYQSEISLLSYPLIDIRLPSQAQVFDLNQIPISEALDVVSARGWFALGMGAIGFIAIGPGAVGIFAFGVGAVGCFTVGVVSIALLQGFGGIGVSLIFKGVFMDTFIRSHPLNQAENQDRQKW